MLWAIFCRRKFTPFILIQSHRLWYQSEAHMRFLIYGRPICHPVSSSFMVALCNTETIYIFMLFLLLLFFLA